MEWSIRTGTRDDIDAILKLWLDADAVESVSDDPAGVETLLARDPEALLVAEAGGDIVGTIVAGWDGWRGALYRLAVVPGARREGVARSLVRAAESRLRALGARKITAMVMRTEGPAIAFWQAAGYDLDARLDRYVRLIDEEGEPGGSPS